MDNLLIKIFCDVDDFCKYYIEHNQKQLIESNTTDDKVITTNTCKLSLSEVITIIIYFHLSDYRKFKNYYKKHVCRVYKKYFPNLVSYNRFVELMPHTIVPLLLYTNMCCLGKPTGISFIDSTPLPVCHNKRIKQHKVFKDQSERGKTSTGWFYGFKLHIVTNDRGEIISFCLTPGNIDDRNIWVIDKLTKDLYGKLFGDKGYLKKDLFEELYLRGIKLITKIKKNMKPKLMEIEDRLLLRKRAVIECTNDFLKNTCNVNHTRHRSPINFVVNLISGICAYSYIPKKPSLKIIRDCDLIV